MCLRLFLLRAVRSSQCGFHALQGLSLAPALTLHPGSSRAAGKMPWLESPAVARAERSQGPVAPWLRQALFESSLTLVFSLAVRKGNVRTSVKLLISLAGRLCVREFLANRRENLA